MQAMQNFLNSQPNNQYGMQQMQQMPQMPGMQQMASMPQMPQMPQMPSMPQFHMPIMPTMPAAPTQMMPQMAPQQQMQQMPQQQMQPMELPPIQAVQSSVMNYTHQQEMPAPTVVETVTIPPVPAVTPQMAQQAAQNVMPQVPPQMQQQAQPQQAMPEMATPIQPQVETNLSPRDLLLAKARAFKESQSLKDRHNTPEQLSMNVDHEQQSLEEARRMAREVLSSPFSNQNLEVPAFIRKKQGFDLNDK
jgi:cell division protein FtsZ